LWVYSIKAIDLQDSLHVP